LPSLVALDIVLNNTKKKQLKQNQAQLQQFKTRHLDTREVCDFLVTNSGHAHKHTKRCKNAVSTYNQPNLESTQNQPKFCVQFWALDMVAKD
jgi:hypothetical protein